MDIENNKIGRLEPSQRIRLLTHFVPQIEAIRTSMEVLYNHLRNVYIDNIQSTTNSSVRFAIRNSQTSGYDAQAHNDARVRDQATSTSVVIEEASDIYRKIISDLLEKLMKDINKLNGEQYQREVHSIWNSMKAVFKVYHDSCTAINTYLDTFGNNLLEDDDALRDKSNIIAEGVRIVREKLILPQRDKIGKHLLEMIEKLRRQQDSEGQQDRNELLEDLFQSFIVCDQEGEIFLEQKRIQNCPTLKYVKKQKASNQKGYEIIELARLADDKRFKSQLLIGAIRNIKKYENDIVAQTHDFFNGFINNDCKQLRIDAYLDAADRILEREEITIKTYFLTKEIQTVIKMKVSDALISDRMTRLIGGIDSEGSDEDDGMKFILEKFSQDENEQRIAKDLLRKLWSLIENRIDPTKFFYIEDHVPDLNDQFLPQIELFVIQTIKNCSFDLEKVKEDDKAGVVITSVTEAYRNFQSINRDCFNDNKETMKTIKLFMTSALKSTFGNNFSFYIICHVNKCFTKNEWRDGLDYLVLIEYVENKVEAIKLYRLALQYRILNRRKCDYEKEKEAMQLLRDYCLESGDEITLIDKMVEDWTTGNKINDELLEFWTKKNQSNIEPYKKIRDQTEFTQLTFSTWENKTGLKKAYTDRELGVPECIKPIDLKWREFLRHKDPFNLYDVQWDQQHSKIEVKFFDIRLLLNIPQMKLLETIDKSPNKSMKWGTLVNRLDLKLDYEDKEKHTKEEKVHITFLKENIMLLFRKKVIVKPDADPKERMRDLPKDHENVAITSKFTVHRKIRKMDLTWNEDIEDIDREDLQNFIDEYTLYAATENMRVICKVAGEAGMPRHDLIKKTREAYSNANLTPRQWGRVYNDFMTANGNFNTRDQRCYYRA